MRQFIRSIAVVAAALAPISAALAQLPPGGGSIVINQTPVSGGSSGQCLFISSGKISSQSCGGGNLTGDVTSVGTVTTYNNSLPAAKMPALTGNCTTTAGTVATTCKAQSAVVNSTWDMTAASGTQVVTGFGFTPSSCDGFGTVNNAAFGGNATLSGHSDSALNQGAEIFAGGGTFMLPGVFLVAEDSAGANIQSAVISAYGAGSVTLTKTKTGTPTGTFTFSIRCFQ